MKNFVAIGDKVQFTATATVNAGECVAVSTLIGVCAATVYSGQTGIANLVGVYRLKKTASQAWTLGAKVYWDATNKEATTTSSGNTLIGAAVEVVGGGATETLGAVRLNGVTV